MKGKIIQYLIMLVLIGTALAAVPSIKKGYEGVKENKMLAESKIVLYEGPKTLRDATEEDLKNTAENNKDFSLLHCTDTKVYVNGEECYVYDTNVNHTRSWVSSYYPPQARTPITYFDFEGCVELKVNVPDIDIETVKISPVAYGIEPIINKDEHTVTFRIDKPDTYTLQFNGSCERALHIFAYGIEKEEDKPDFNDPNVIYIGPGEWDVENISLASGQTLYISGGAVVHGIINANFVSNITVMGHGILDGSKLEGWKGTSASIPLKFDHCENITLKDVIVLNSNAWVCQAYDSKNGVIDGLRIISSRPNGDGISIQSCQDYEIRNCFVRSWDDSLVVKNYDTNSCNVAFSNMQLWTDLAQSMEIGYETNKGKKADASITNISFEDITVLNNYHKPVISVHNADDAVVDNILFKNITVEHEEIGSGDSDLKFLIDIAVVQNGNWSSTTERGSISNVTLENVNFLEGTENVSRIRGFDSNHRVSNIVFKNLTIFGEKIDNADQANIKIDENTVDAVTFE